MRTVKTIHVISCHAEGEVGDVIVGGVPAPAGSTLWEQRNSIVESGELRDFMLNEPRGGVFRHVNLLVPAVHPDAAMGFIIMEPEDTPPMSGSNSICVATVLLDSGIIPMEEPTTRMVLEAPGGLVNIEAKCKDGKAESISVTNLPSFVQALDVIVDVPGLGKVNADIAFGGDSFVIVDAASLGFSLIPSEAKILAEIGVRITDAANEQIGFNHPGNTDWTHISFCLFTGPLDHREDGLHTRAACAIKPGKIDRSPTGTALSARMAVLHARNQMQPGELLTVQSIIDSVFYGEIVGTTDVNGHPAIVPCITGRAWITGIHQHMLDPTDPWPRGYRLSDTWPNSN